MSFPSIMGIAARDLPEGLRLAHVYGYDYQVREGNWERLACRQERKLVSEYFDSVAQETVQVFAYVSCGKSQFSFAPSFECNSDTETEESPPSPSAHAHIAPRKRGRPRKHFKKYSREPTMYNKFVRETLPHVDQTLDVNARMRVVANMWKSQKSVQTS